MTQVESIVDHFMRNGDPRSSVYRRGAADCLSRRCFGAERRPPYKMGTVEADAYWSGYDRGWFIWRNIQRVTVEEQP